MCTEFTRIIVGETITGGSNEAVADRINHRLHTIYRRGEVGGYFLVVYDAVWGGDKHWGGESHCMGDRFFRLNGKNIRFYYKTCKGKRCSSKLGGKTTLRICWGCGVWYNSAGVDLEYSNGNGWHYFDVY